MNEYLVEPGFASGADISWLPMMEATGFKFRDSGGVEKDFFEILKGYGMNAIRLRAWVDPSKHPHSGHCSTAETLAMGLRAKKHGMDVMVDFHYGDTWCDPGHQNKPAAWEGLSFDALADAVYRYTLDTMGGFVANGFVPKWVQIGNETNPGMLLPEGSIVNFNRLARLFDAGINAVRAASPYTQTILHLAEGHNTEFCKSYFDAVVRCGCKFNIIGLSYYPYWAKKPNAEIIGALKETVKMAHLRFGKGVMIVEVGGVDEEEDESYEILRSVIEVCASETGCKGVFYWEPGGAKVWSGYSLSAWRADGTPSRAMDGYKLIKWRK